MQSSCSVWHNLIFPFHNHPKLILWLNRIDKRFTWAICRGFPDMCSLSCTLLTSTYNPFRGLLVGFVNQINIFDFFQKFHLNWQWYWVFSPILSGLQFLSPSCCEMEKKILLCCKILIFTSFFSSTCAHLVSTWALRWPFAIQMCRWLGEYGAFVQYL